MSSNPRRSFRLKTGHTLPEAIAIAKNLTKRKLFHIGKPELANELAELGYVGEEAMVEALLTALGEVAPAHYAPPAEPDKVPGIPFVWDSQHFGRRMYLKFKLVGTRPTLWWYSCHAAYQAHL